MVPSNEEHCPQPDEAAIKKTKQISFKVEDSAARRIESAAELEDIPLADFVRKIFAWGFDQYESVGSLRGLRSMSLSEDLIEQTLKEERHAFRARLRKASGR
jgi:hypothetical protein